MRTLRRLSDFSRPRLLILAAALTLLLAAPPAWAAGASIAVDVSPRSIGLDETANLTITVEGSAQSAPTLPDVDGLQLEVAGRSSRIESVNGRMSVAETVHVRIFPERTGTFRIDPASFRVDGRAGTGPVIELEVTPRGRAAAPAPDDAVAAPDAGPFLQVALDRERPFVGELVPLRIEAWFPEGVRASVQSLPRTTSTSFTLHVPEQDADVERRIHDGHAYRVATWRAALVGVKAGVHDLPLEMEATVGMPQKRRSRGARRSRLGSLLDDDFFGGSPLASMLRDDPFFSDDLLDDFFARVVERPVTLRSQDLRVDVRPLPSEGRPAGFAGAVGSFQLALGPVPSAARTGDPIEVETRVRGEGNFALVQAPATTPDARLRIYPPESDFEAADELGSVGRKRFTQRIVVRDPSVESLPPFRFAYFDPQAERYEVLETAAAKIDVSGEVLAPQATPPVDAGASNEEVADRQSPPVALPDPDEARTYVPLPFRPAFDWALGATLALLGAGVFLSVQRARRERDPDRTARRAARADLRRAHASFEAAGRTGSSSAPLLAGRSLLQTVLGRAWGLEPASITGADVRRRHPEWTEVAAVFDAADAVTFGGGAPEGPDSDPWTERVLRALETVECER